MCLCVVSARVRARAGKREEEKDQYYLSNMIGYTNELPFPSGTYVFLIKNLKIPLVYPESLHAFFYPKPNAVKPRNPKILKIISPPMSMM